MTELEKRLRDSMSAHELRAPRADRLVVAKSSSTWLRVGRPGPVLVAVLALVVATAIAVAGIRYHGSGSAPAGPATSATPTPASTSTTQLVSYRGVQVRAPRTWPVSDGVHTLPCDGPFPATPTVFLGPSSGNSPSCPFSGQPETPMRDGVWLLAAPRPEGVATRDLANGQQVLVMPTYIGAEAFWYEGVQVLIGVGADPRTADAIENSLDYRAGAIDTAVPDSCGTSSGPNAMPTPVRLAQRLVLNRGQNVLDPPRPTDQATMTAAAAWSASGPKSSFDTYRLILARYSAAFPAEAGAGSLTPFNHDVLAWIVYSTAVRPDVKGCSGGGVSVFDARTGRSLDNSAWSPGP